jgi:hypothetical protein
MERDGKRGKEGRRKGGLRLAEPWNNFEIPNKIRGKNIFLTFNCYKKNEF